MSIKTKNRSPLRAETATIDISTSTTVSNAIDLAGGVIVGIEKPTTTGTAITFQTSMTEGGTFAAVYDQDGNAITITTATGAQNHSLQPAITAGFSRYVKLVSGTAELADRDITVLIKDVS